MKRVPAVLLAALLVLSLSGCKVMKRISDGAYENAVADGSATLLGDRGVRLKARPMCRMPDTRSDALLRVHCTARTTMRRPGRGDRHRHRCRHRAPAGGVHRHRRRARGAAHALPRPRLPTFLNR